MHLFLRLRSQPVLSLKNLDDGPFASRVGENYHKTKLYMQIHVTLCTKRTEKEVEGCKGSTYKTLTTQTFNSKSASSRNTIRIQETSKPRERYRTFRPGSDSARRNMDVSAKSMDVSAKEYRRFGQRRWTFRPKRWTFRLEKVDVSARKN